MSSIQTWLREPSGNIFLHPNTEIYYTQVGGLQTFNCCSEVFSVCKNKSYTLIGKRKLPKFRPKKKCEAKVARSGGGRALMCQYSDWPQTLVIVLVMKLLQIVFLQHTKVIIKDKKKNQGERERERERAGIIISRVIYLPLQGQPRNHYEYL